MDNIQNKTADSTRAKGKVSEEIAEKYLTDKGYSIIKKNFHFGKLGELDIVAKDGDILVFVEVKSCTTKDFGDPLNQITRKKAFQLMKVAQGYLAINKLENADCRFDVVTVDFSEKPMKIEHLVNVQLF